MEVRRAAPSDWAIVREVRLRALADAPDAFGSSYEHEVAFPESVWIDRLGTVTNATFLCEVDEQCCGIVTLIHDGTEDHVGSMVGMWIAPSARGTGVADLLVESLLLWADEKGITAVRLHIAEGNARAERFYRRHAFLRTGEVHTGIREGLVEIEMRRSASPQQQ